MSLRPPPLQWLPAFEAAARLLSFRRAAEALHITPSALGQQIRQLEAHLGHPLFHRLTRRVELTAFGQAYAELAADIVQRHQQGHARVLQRFQRPVLRVSMTPLVAHELVLPALGDFQAMCPHLDLHIEATMDLVDLQLGVVDAAVRFGEGPWPGVQAWPLSRCRATLVASPALARRLPLKRLGDLALHTLIHQRPDQADWALAARLFGRERLPRKADLVLDSNLAALRAAEQGLGVAIAVWPLVQSWIAQGRLVALWPPMPLAEGDHFLCRVNDPRQEALRAVYGWLQGLFERLESDSPLA